jgi:hypothetical protein
MAQIDNYEPLTHLHNQLEYAEHLQRNIIARATGLDYDSNNYKKIRDQFLSDPQTKELLPDFIRVNREINQFWIFIKDKFPSYAERRTFIYESFQPLIGYLEEIELIKSGASTLGLSAHNKALTIDQELNLLIEEAKSRFTNPKDKRIALEKLWDAFERVKTYFNHNKQKSAEELVKLISSDFDYEFIKGEFQTLTTIGNDYRIRHHETNRKEIPQEKHVEYLFFRMLGLLNLCVVNIHEQEKSTDLTELW